MMDEEFKQEVRQRFDQLERYIRHLIWLLSVADPPPPPNDVSFPLEQWLPEYEQPLRAHLCRILPKRGAPDTEHMRVFRDLFADTIFPRGAEATRNAPWMRICRDVWLRHGPLTETQYGPIVEKVVKNTLDRRRRATRRRRERQARQAEHEMRRLESLAEVAQIESLPATQCEEVPAANEEVEDEEMLPEPPPPPRGAVAVAVAVAAAMVNEQQETERPSGAKEEEEEERQRRRERPSSPSPRGVTPSVIERHQQCRWWAEAIEGEQEEEDEEEEEEEAQRRRSESVVSSPRVVVARMAVLAEETTDSADLFAEMEEEEEDDDDDKEEIPETEQPIAWDTESQMTPGFQRLLDSL